MKMRHWLWLLVGALGTGGCLTPAKERQYNDDIFSLQTRVLQLENRLSNQDKSYQTRDESANQRLASASTSLEKVNGDLQRLRGEIDALRVGVMTGQMPGTDPDQEGSVAKTLSELAKRLEGVEEQQKQILTAIEKSSSEVATETKGGKDQDRSATKDRDEQLRSYGDLKKAFETKKYKAVAADADAVLASTKKKTQKEDIVFFQAESLFKLGKLRDAALKYNDFVDMKPAAKRITQAKLRMGDCFRSLGDKETAKLYYEELVAKHPNTAEAKKAKELLSKL